MTDRSRHRPGRPSFGWPALRILEYHALLYRRTWRGSLFTTFLAPILFLGAMGLGLGGYVDAAQPGGIDGVPYLIFLAPGLLAAQAMQTATFAASYPVMSGIVWSRTYQAMLATPATSRDVVLGLIAWIVVRLVLMSIAFVAVMYAFGAVASPSSLVMIVAAVLTGIAFGAPMAAFAATQRNDVAFAAINRFGLTPLFLFSGTFFPLSQLPDWLQPLAWVTPLFHGVELTRGLALGSLELVPALVHGTALVGLAAAGVVASIVTFRRRMVR